MKKLESTLKNMILSLLAVTCISAGLLAYINEMTKDKIAQGLIEKNVNALKKIFPDFDNDPMSESKDIDMQGQTLKIYPIFLGGKFIGSAVNATSTGYGGAINILVGFNEIGEIVGYNVISQSETPGLGSKVETWFQKGGKGDVIGLNPSDPNFKVSKDGGKIDAITASTITSRAFLKAIKIAYHAYIEKEQVDTSSGATSLVKDKKEE